ncbi:MAG: sigma-54-dependent Fis family transcriptional regulator [Planctomycetes bacterium]|nr:sigma-54-dependent Fis family transcriptional regulator [Planctomycetota bacterium]
MARPTILGIDDKPNMLQLLKTLLGEEYQVETTGEPQAGIDLVARMPIDVVVSDIRMPSMDGLAVLREVKRLSPATEVVLMTGYATVKQAVEAMKLGAFDYVIKPFEPEQMAAVVEKALEHKRLLDRTRYLEGEVEEKFGLGSIMGASAAIQAMLVRIRKVLDSDSTVLVAGESGTGKELVARALHYAGRRRRGKFVVVHCAGIPRELAESEIFGHVRGAFSGALTAKRGLADEADGGTLFLDDVDQLDLDVQAKMNRLVQQKEIRAVGETEWRRVDVRIVAATNQELHALVAKGRFREDFYYRLNVFPVEVPPLRARKEDLARLAAHFLERHARVAGRPPAQISAQAMQALERHDWPGNVRELENVLETAMLLAEEGVIEPSHLPALQRRPRSAAGASAQDALELPYATVLEQASAEAACRYLSGVLKKYGGNVTRAAQHAGIERQSFHRLMKKHGLGSHGVEEGSER